MNIASRDMDIRNNVMFHACSAVILYVHSKKALLSQKINLLVYFS